MVRMDLSCSRTGGVPMLVSVNRGSSLRTQDSSGFGKYYCILMGLAIILSKKGGTVLYINSIRTDRSEHAEPGYLKVW